MLSLPAGTEVEVRAPVSKIYGEDYEYLIDQIRVNGYRRARIDGKECDLGGELTLDEEKQYELDAIVDRFVIQPDIEKQIVASLEHGLELGGGMLGHRDGIGGQVSVRILSMTRDRVVDGRLDPTSLQGRSDFVAIRDAHHVLVKCTLRFPVSSYHLHEVRTQQVAVPGHRGPPGVVPAIEPLQLDR